MRLHYWSNYLFGVDGFRAKGLIGLTNVYRGVTTFTVLRKVFLCRNFLSLQNKVSFTSTSSIHSPRSFNGIVLKGRLRNFLPSSHLYLKFRFTSRRVGATTLFHRGLYVTSNVYRGRHLYLLGGESRHLNKYSNVRVGGVVQTSR